MSPQYELEQTSQGQYYGPDSSIVTYEDWIRGTWYAFVGSERLSGFISSSEPVRSDGFATERALLSYLESIGYTAGAKKSDYPKNNFLNDPQQHLSQNL